MLIPILIAIVLGGFLFWIGIPWLWAHLSIGGGLLMSGSLLVGTPVTPSGQVIQRQAPPAPVAVASPVATLQPFQVWQLRVPCEDSKTSPQPDCAEFNPPVIVVLQH